MLEKSLLIKSVLFVLITISAYAQQYEIIELNINIPDAQLIKARAFNESNQVMEIADFNIGIERGKYFIFDNGDVQVLSVSAYLPYIREAGDINSSGNLCGAKADEFVYQAFKYQDGAVSNLGWILPATNFSVAYDINENNAIVGYSSIEDNSGQSHPFIYQNGTMTDLGTLGGTQGFALAINNKNCVVGNSRLPDFSQHAFLYKNGSMIDLGIMPGTNNSFAFDINDDTLIVGISGSKAFKWDGLNGLQELPSLPGTVNQGAFFINNNGIIAGEILSPAYTPVIWLNDEVYALDSLLINSEGWTITRLLDLNENDELLCEAKFNDDDRIVILKPSAVKKTIIVNSTGDEEDADLNDEVCDVDLDTSGEQCTLRAAIQQANHNPGKDKITFDIPGNGIPIINLQSPLPPITDEVEIDGFDAIKVLNKKEMRYEITYMPFSFNHISRISSYKSTG